VEGQSRPSELNDSVGYSGTIPKHITCGNSQCINALRRQPGIPAFVTLWAVATVVRLPVDLDRKARIGAVEIERQVAA